MQKMSFLLTSKFSPSFHLLIAIDKMIVTECERLAKQSEKRWKVQNKIFIIGGRLLSLDIISTVEDKRR